MSGGYPKSSAEGGPADKSGFLRLLPHYFLKSLPYDVFKFKLADVGDLHYQLLVVCCCFDHFSTSEQVYVVCQSKVEFRSSFNGLAEFLRDLVEFLLSGWYCSG